MKIAILIVGATMSKSELNCEKENTDHQRNLLKS